IGMVVAFFYCLCGALRLARCNANIDKVKSDFFQGLPIPGAAIAVLSFILVSIEFPNYFDNPYFTIVYLLFYSVLIISTIPFDFFQGLPIPGAAIAVLSFILVSIEFPNYFDNRYFTIGYLLFYSVLMISNIPFASFKNSEWVRTHKKAVFFIILMVMCSLFIYE